MTTGRINQVANPSSARGWVPPSEPLAPGSPGGDEGVGGRAGGPRGTPEERRRLGNGPWQADTGRGPGTSPEGAPGGLCRRLGPPSAGRLRT